MSFDLRISESEEQIRKLEELLKKKRARKAELERQKKQQQQHQKHRQDIQQQHGRGMQNFPANVQNFRCCDEIDQAGDDNGCHKQRCDNALGRGQEFLYLI